MDIKWVRKEIGINFSEYEICVDYDFSCTEEKLNTTKFFHHNDEEIICSKKCQEIIIDIVRCIDNDIFNTEILTNTNIYPHSLTDIYSFWVDYLKSKNEIRVVVYLNTKIQNYTHSYESYSNFSPGHVRCPNLLREKINKLIDHSS